MNIEQSPSQRFEQLVAELFTRLGHTDVKTNVQFTGSLGHAYEIDILFGEPTKAVVVEVKHYRYASPPRAEMLLRALRQAKAIKNEARAKCMLVMSCPLTPSLSAAASEFPDVEVWDARLLLERASVFPDLLKRFEQTLEVSAADVLQTPTARAASNAGTTDAPIEEAKGTTLADALKAVSPGRATASDFEDKCIAALKYLFEGDLFSWHEQLETEDGLHRRDLVCRILPNSEVWHLMLTDLRSRYVVFEFKNYAEPITQNEIVTTEKYLYPSALRNVAIIVSPQGCSKSAKKVIQGAMREHGKLIISLTVDELATLLVGKDSGSDPNTYLFERVDEFLMSLGR